MPDWRHLLLIFPEIAKHFQTGGLMSFDLYGILTIQRMKIPAVSCGVSGTEIPYSSLRFAAKGSAPRGGEYTRPDSKQPPLLHSFNRWQLWNCSNWR